MSDLTGLLLDCAAWGLTEPGKLTWLDPPPAATLNASKHALRALGALDADGRITKFGEAIRDLPVTPVLAAMICKAAILGHAVRAARIAALLVERGIGGNSTDLDDRLQRFETDRSDRARAMREMAGRWARAAERAMTSMPHIESVRAATLDFEGDTRAVDALSTAGILSLAYPDRIAKARGRGNTSTSSAGMQFLMAGGSGGFLAEDDSLAGARYLVIADLQGAARSGRITAAAAIDEAELVVIAGNRMSEETDITFDPEHLQVRARRSRRLDAITISSEPIPIPDDADAASTLSEGIATIGVQVLPWTKTHQQFRARVAFLRRTEPETWPDLSDAGLEASWDQWLAPLVAGKSSVQEISCAELRHGLDLLIGWDLRKRLETEAPTHFTAPTGERHVITYDGEHAPSVSLRVQELFGLEVHPAIAGGKLPLTLFLLSPAARPIQVTRDLPGFWAGSWSDVRADLRGRYPKHPWPEDPANAEPTRRAKRRGEST